MRFTERDLDRWVKEGVITPAQREAMVADLSSRPSFPRLDLTTLLYYGGGLLVLLAYSIFLGLQWEDMNSASRIGISAASLVFFAVVSQVLIKSESFRLPGELLQVAAVAVVPLLVSSLLEAVGWWPHEPDYRRFNYNDFDYNLAWHQYAEDMIWARMALGGVTLVAAAVAFASSRSPFVLIAAFASLTSFLLDSTIQVRSPSEFDNYEWGVGQSLTIAAVGALALAGGVLSRDRSERDYAIWLYVFGIVALAVGLGFKALDEDSSEAIWGTIWMATAVTLLVLSLVLQERVFAVAGLAGIFAYFAKLVFDVFESANAALALIVLGLAVLGIGMLYQRYNERLFTRQTPTD
jgi:hypothetical protein